TLKQTVEAVKETVGSFSAVQCVRDHPASALGTTALAGFLAGYFLPRERLRPLSRPVPPPSSDGDLTTSQVGRPGIGYTAFVPSEPATPVPSRPGLFDHVWELAGRELRQVAEQAMATAVSALKQSIATRLPEVVDRAVHRMTEPAATASTEATSRV